VSLLGLLGYGEGKNTEVIGLISFTGLIGFTGFNQ